MDDRRVLRDSTGHTPSPCFPIILFTDSLTLLLAGRVITYLTGVLWGFPLTLAAMLGKPLGGKAL